jgi:hypothetical protein
MDLCLRSSVSHRKRGNPAGHHKYGKYASNSGSTSSGVEENQHDLVNLRKAVYIFHGEQFINSLSLMMPK